MTYRTGYREITLEDLERNMALYNSGYESGIPFFDIELEHKNNGKIDHNLEFII